MSVRVGIVMDPIADISYKKDSSLAMLLAAQARGWTLFYMEQQDLYLTGRVIDDQNASHGVPHLKGNRLSGRASLNVWDDVKTRYMGLDGTQQFISAEGLGQKLIRADNASFGLVKQTVLGGQHNHRRILERPVVLDQGARLITIQARHHDVDKNNMWVMVNNLGQCIKTVDGRNDLAAHVFQQGFSGPANGFRVIDHHHLQGAGMLVHMCPTIATATRFVTTVSPKTANP